MSKYSFAVVVPAYNVEDYLGECLDSVFSNCFKGISIQVIVVDDGSVDCTYDIASNYLVHDNFYLFRQENKGQSAARNYGVQNVDAKYIFFVDADDLVENNLVSGCLEYFTNHDVDMVLYDAKEFYTNKNPVLGDDIYTRPSGCYDQILSPLEYFNLAVVSNQYNVSPCLYAFRTSVLIDLKFQEGVIYEDNLYTTFLLLTQRVRKLICVNEKYYRRRIRDDSTVTANKKMKHYSDYHTVFSELAQRMDLSQSVSGYNKYLASVLAKSIEIISDITDMNFKQKLYLRFNILLSVIVDSRLWYSRVYAAILLGKHYKKLAQKIKAIARKYKWLRF